MNDRVRSGVEVGDSAGQAAERAHTLRMQADWCVGMAAKVSDARLFRAYVDAAAVYQEQAQSIELGLGLKKGLLKGIPTEFV